MLDWCAAGYQSICWKEVCIFYHLVWPEKVSNGILTFLVEARKQDKDFVEYCTMWDFSSDLQFKSKDVRSIIRHLVWHFQPQFRSSLVQPLGQRSLLSFYKEFDCRPSFTIPVLLLCPASLGGQPRVPRECLHVSRPCSADLTGYSKLQDWLAMLSYILRNY